CKLVNCLLEGFSYYGLLIASYPESPRASLSENIVTENVAISTAVYAYYLYKAESEVLDSSKLQGDLYGVLVDQSSYNTFLNNVIANNQTLNVSVTDGSSTGNIFKGNTIFHGSGSNIQDNGNLTIFS